MLVEEVVLLITFAITELKRLMFIGSITDSIKVRVRCWDNVILPINGSHAGGLMDLHFPCWSL